MLQFFQISSLLSSENHNSEKLKPGNLQSIQKKCANGFFVLWFSNSTNKTHHFRFSDGFCVLFRSFFYKNSNYLDKFTAYNCATSEMSRATLLRLMGQNFSSRLKHTFCDNLTCYQKNFRFVSGWKR